MPRPKSNDKDKLVHLIRVRLNAEVYQKLTDLRKKTDCRSICELVRKILAKQQIIVLHKDVSMSGPMEELALIRRELKSIGININQQTYHFHISQSSSERAFYVSRTAELYRKIDERVMRLLTIVHELSLVWLRK
ncbi:plasmid mobilization protein [Pedobacter agri]|uniref:plasmid mobilization protein n=1 Tax=Pedobacter agri TaxID=454586 RepID=UPI00292D32CE|nr:mobilization protein [Pedobacter agri]